jgi:hypothetical protein
MERRAFIGTVAGGLLAAPFISFAQQPAKVARIGVLGTVQGPAYEGLSRGLRELGYIDGRIITLEWRWAEGKTDRFHDFAIELRGANAFGCSRKSRRKTRVAVLWTRQTRLSHFLSANC